MKNDNANNSRLIISVLMRLISALIILGVLFFSTAGTLSYINGWLYLLTMTVLMSTGFTILYIKDRALLEKRMRMKEKEKQQIAFLLISLLIFIAIYALPGIDYRFKWSNVPIWQIIIAEMILIAGYIIFLTVMMENSYASRIIEIQEGQKLVDKGLYSIVRHPMYSSSILIYFSTPIILGSYIAAIPALLFPFILVIRIMNEEKVLSDGLEGYKDYIKRVKYRLIPFIW